MREEREAQAINGWVVIISAFFCFAIDGGASSTWALHFDFLTKGLEHRQVLFCRALYDEDWKLALHWIWRFVTQQAMVFLSI